MQTMVPYTYGEQPYFQPDKLTIMKKIILALTFLLAAPCLFAQNVTFGIQGGINIPTIGPTDPQNTGAGAQIYPTFQFGGVLDVKLKHFSFQPGIFITGKGNRSVTTENFVSNGNPVPYNMTHITTLGYIEVPLNIVYKHTIKPGALYFGAGPYAAYAVWGSYDNKSVLNTYYNRVARTDVSFGSGSDQLKSMDYGANILAGLEMNNGMKLGLNYGLGFSNISNAGISSKNRVFAVVIGYKIK